MTKRLEIKDELMNSVTGGKTWVYNYETDDRIYSVFGYSEGESMSGINAFELSVDEFEAFRRLHSDDEFHETFVSVPDLCPIYGR